MNDFKVGQQVEISTDPKNTHLSIYMLEKLGYRTKILGTIVHIVTNNQILIHSNQLEEYGLGHDGNYSKRHEPYHEKGCWWVGASQLKPYHEQPSLDLDKLFKEENNE